MMNVSTRAAPSGATTISAANEHSSGTYAAVNTPAVTSRTKCSAPAGIRQSSTQSAVAANATATAAAPNGQASHTIACPPTSSTGSGTRMSAPRRSAPASSQVPTAAASASTAMNQCRSMSSDASTTAPSPTPTPMAATRLRPARPEARSLPRGGADTAGVSGWLAVIRPRAARLPCVSPARRPGGRSGRRWPAAPSRPVRPRPRPPRRRARCGAAPPSPCGGGCGS